MLQNPLDVLDKAHVQHLVGLIENHITHVGQVQAAASNVVHHPPRRPDDHLRALAEAAQLAVNGLAAIDGQDADAAIAAILVARLGHLDGQLARGGEHDGLDLAQGRVHPFEHGQGKGGRLARAGLRLTDDVLPLHQQADGLRLDGGRGLIAQVANRFENGFTQT